MKIAIVEDDKTIREELSKLLKKHDYDTILIEDFDNITDYTSLWLGGSSVLHCNF